MQVTSLDQLKKIKRTEVILVGAFEDGTELVAEVKKPDMMALMASGKVPNALLKPAMQVFNGKTKEITDKVGENDLEALKDMVGLLDVFAKETLVNPSYKDIQDCGIDLTMEMKLNLMAYAQGGVQALESFRTEQVNNANNQSSNEVQ